MGASGGKGSDFVNFLICGGLNVVLGGGVKELPSSMWDISAALSMGTLPLNELLVSYVVFFNHPFLTQPYLYSIVTSVCDQ